MTIKTAPRSCERSPKRFTTARSACIVFSDHPHPLDRDPTRFLASAIIFPRKRISARCRNVLWNLLEGISYSFKIYSVKIRFEEVMADLGSNSMWSDISGSTTDILGPDYSYADNIQGPSAQGVGSDGTFSQLGRNASAIAYYVQTLITGDPPLGNQFFVNTGGTCTASDGQLRSRYNYVNNMSSGSAALPASMSELGSDFNGLIPGVVDDIEGLNPTYLFSAMTADSSPSCGCYKCNVTSGTPYQFLTPSLDPDFSSDQCQEVDISNCSPPSTESFGNQWNYTLPVAIVGILALLVFSAK